MTGQKALGRHFPGGAGNPAVVIAAADRQAQVRERARGVDSARVVDSADRRRRGRPGAHRRHPEGPRGQRAAKETVVGLRQAVHAVPGAQALVGGYTAQRTTRSGRPNGTARSSSRSCWPSSWSSWWPCCVRW